MDKKEFERLCDEYSVEDAIYILIEDSILREIDNINKSLEKDLNLVSLNDTNIFHDIMYETNIIENYQLGSDNSPLIKSGIKKIICQSIEWMTDIDDVNFEGNLECLEDYIEILKILRKEECKY